MNEEIAFNEFSQQRYINRVSAEDAFFAGYKAASQKYTLIDVNAELPELTSNNNGGYISADVLGITADGVIITVYLYASEYAVTPVWLCGIFDVTYQVDIVAWRPL